MAQPATNPKIEELRLRLKSDPKNRIFYPLAEELRKVGQYAEAEQVLRAGLTNHPTYLSAWVSLGRVLRELKNDAGAIEALNKALQLDPGNVVAARLLAEAYLSIGEKVEAIKKYKLVHALLPADEEVEAIITQLDRELNPPPAPVPSPQAAAEEVESAPKSAALPIEESPFAPEAPAATPKPEELPFAAPPAVLGDETATFPPGRPTPPSIERLQQETAPAASGVEPQRSLSSAEPASPWTADESQVFGEAVQALEQESQTEIATGDAEPMSAAHTESPFEEPTSYTAAAFEVESPGGLHVSAAPLVAEVPAEIPAEIPPLEPAAASTPADEADVFEPAAEVPTGATREEPFAAAAPQPDVTSTLTMAELYAKQGLIADARQIYETILLRDPGNAMVRQRLEELTAPLPASAEPPAAERQGAPDARVAKLQGWLARVGKREAGSV